MKKNIVLLMLLLCGAFSTLSAQSVLRWSVYTADGSASLKIKIDGVVVVNVQQAQYASPQSGVIPVNNYSTIEYEATTSGAPLLCGAGETELIPGYFDGIYAYWATHGYLPDPIAFSESGSWTAYDDFDYTIQLTTIPYYYY